MKKINKEISKEEYQQLRLEFKAFLNSTLNDQVIDDVYGNRIQSPVDYAHFMLYGMVRGLRPSQQSNVQCKDKYMRALTLAMTARAEYFSKVLPTIDSDLLSRIRKPFLKS